MSRTPDFSRLPLQSLQRELGGRSLRRPSEHPGRGIDERDCPEDDVLYVSVAMKTWDIRVHEEGDPAQHEPEMCTKIRIWVHTSAVPEEQPERRIWQEKSSTVIHPILVTMREGVETALRNAGFSAPFQWVDLYEPDNFWNEGFEFERFNVPENLRTFKVLMDVFHRALDYASGYPSRVIKGSIAGFPSRVFDNEALVPLRRADRFSASAALCIGEGMGEQGYDLDFWLKHEDPNATSEEEADSDDDEDME